MDTQEMREHHSSPPEKRYTLAELAAILKNVPTYDFSTEGPGMHHNHLGVVYWLHKDTVMQALGLPLGGNSEVGS